MNNTNNTAALLTKTLGDSFRREDMAPAVAAPRKLRSVKLWQIAYTTADGTRKASAKLYPHAVARKLVARLNRRAHADAYASPLTVTK